MSDFVCGCHNKEFKTKQMLQTHLYYIRNKEKRIKQVINYNKTSLAYQKYLKENNEKMSIVHKNYRNSIEYQSKMKEYNLKVKKEIFTHYGGKCVCCGETILDFLAMDHINNDGNKHRKELKSQGITNPYHFIRRNNYPSNFQILCHNCNISKRINHGKCFHQLELEKSKKGEK